MCIDVCQVRISNICITDCLLHDVANATDRKSTANCLWINANPEILTPDTKNFFYVLTIVLPQCILQMFEYLIAFVKVKR